MFLGRKELLSLPLLHCSLTGSSFQSFVHTGLISSPCFLMQERLYWTACSSTQDNSPDCIILLAQLLFSPAEDQKDSLDRFPVVLFAVCPRPCGHPACVGSTWDPSWAGREVVTMCCTECWLWKTWDFHQGALVSRLVITQGIASKAHRPLCGDIITEKGRIFFHVDRVLLYTQK